MIKDFITNQNEDLKIKILEVGNWKLEFGTWKLTTHGN